MKTRLMLMAAALAFASAAVADDTTVPYPQDYRDWRHVKTMVIAQGHPLYESFGGIHHLYANEKALQGYASGEFPDGAVIAFDLFEAVSADNSITEGQHKVLGIMVKDSQLYAATGGWGFEGFAGGDPNTRAVGDQAATACFACHAAQKDNDYVFSAARP